MCSEFGLAFAFRQEAWRRADKQLDVAIEWQTETRLSRETAALYVVWHAPSMVAIALQIRTFCGVACGRCQVVPRLALY